MLPASVILAGLLLAPAAELTVKPTDWPQYRGPNRDAISPEKGLLQKWPEKGPAKLWTVSGVGGGYSTVAVVDGFVFGTGKKDKKEHLWKLKESDGSEVWSTPFADVKDVGYGEGCRSTPCYAAGKVYAISPGGTLACVDADKGTVVWKKDFADKEFGGKMMSGWGYSESVLVDGDKLICTPGGDAAAVAALNPKTGAVIWKTAVTKAGGAGYASPIKAEVGGVPMYITLLGKSGGVVGVHAKTGKLLWQYTKTANGTANIPSVVVKDDLVFTSTGYGDGGSALLKLKADSKGGVTADELKYYSSKELQNHHGGMVAVGDYIYFGNAHNQGKPVCVEFKTGDIKWKEDASPGKGDGSAAVAYADGMLYFRYQNGVMVLLKADPKEFAFVSRFDIPEKSGKPSWPHPTIANGKLFLRDQDKLHCFNIKDASN